MGFNWFGFFLIYAIPIALFGAAVALLAVYGMASRRAKRKPQKPRQKLYIEEIH